jgi:RimJ/RimL family protein N-acetyltransferase
MARRIYAEQFVNSTTIDDVAPGRTRGELIHARRITLCKEGDQSEVARQHSRLTTRLVPWSDGDFPLLVRLNAPEMTVHLGGPETDEALRKRHERYAAAARSDIVQETDRTFPAYVNKVILEPDGIAVGNVSVWDREWKGEQVYEMGWGIVPEHQGRGVASAAVTQALELVRATRRRPAVHAFPSVDNAASNRVCRKSGFLLLGEVDFEYPKGHRMRCADWRFSFADRPSYIPLKNERAQSRAFGENRRSRQTSTLQFTFQTEGTGCFDFATAKGSFSTR